MVYLTQCKHEKLYGQSNQPRVHPNYHNDLKIQTSVIRTLRSLLLPPDSTSEVVTKFESPTIITTTTITHICEFHRITLQCSDHTQLQLYLGISYRDYM